MYVCMYMCTMDLSLFIFAHVCLLICLYLYTHNLYVCVYINYLYICLYGVQGFNTDYTFAKNL